MKKKLFREYSKILNEILGGHRARYITTPLGTFELYKNFLNKNFCSYCLSSENEGTIFFGIDPNSKDAEIKMFMQLLGIIMQNEIK